MIDETEDDLDPLGNGFIEKACQLGLRCSMLIYARCSATTPPWRFPNVSRILETVPGIITVLTFAGYCHEQLATHGAAVPKFGLSRDGLPEIYSLV